MIRIHLRRPGRTGATRVLPILVSLVAVAGMGLGGLYWLDQRLPLQRLWRQTLTAVLASTMGRESASASGVAADSLTDASEPLPPASAPPPALSAPPPPASPAAPPPTATNTPVPTATPVVDAGSAARDADAVQDAAPVGQATRLAHTGTGGGDGRGAATFSTAACARALRISAHMPARIHLTALTCKSGGEYSLEGVSPAQQPVEAFLKVLQRAPSRVDLSWWRSDVPRPASSRVLHFVFQGEFRDLQSQALKGVSQADAVDLWRRMGSWAASAHLGEVTLGKLITLGEAPGNRHLRRKLWAAGSWAQIRSFLHHLEGVGEVMALVEVVIVPVQAGSSGAERERLYCVMDVLQEVR